MKTPHVIRTKNFAADAAGFILDQAHKALGERHEFRIALSGGNTPVPVYTRLAVIGHDLPWELTRITFGDERCVPPDDRESNFRMARETLLAPAAVPEKSIFRMRGEIDPQVAAQEYQDQTIRRVVANFVPKLDAWRLTFTFPLINQARQICFLVGASKNSNLIERVIEGDPQFPASRVNPSAGDVTWIIGQS
jgi:6-phosphogluconolactonase